MKRRDFRPLFILHPSAFILTPPIGRVRFSIGPRLFSQDSGTFAPPTATLRLTGNRLLRLPCDVFVVRLTFARRSPRARLCGNRENFMKLVVTIPAQNEQATIANVVAGIPRKITGITEVEIIVVNDRSEEHTSELQSPCNLVCRLLLEKK